MTATPSTEQVQQALATVQDPEIHRPITDLGMVKSVDIAEDGAVHVGIYLAIAGCPMKGRIEKDVAEATSKVDGVTSVTVELDVMSDEQRKELQTKLRGGRSEERRVGKDCRSGRWHAPLLPI